MGLVVPRAEFVAEWAEANDRPGAVADPAADEALTVDNQMMTPTLKIRRHKIAERYGEALEALY